MRKNISGQSVSFLALAVADGSPVTTGTPSIVLSKDGAAQTVSANSATHFGNGVWGLDLTQAETNCDHLVASMTLATAVGSMVQAYPYVVADFMADITTLATSSAVSALNNFDPASDAVANVTLVATCTTNTDQRGTDGAATAANLAIVDGVVDANKVILDKVETGLILDGAVYQWTTNALENAPSSGGSAPTASDIYAYFTTGTNEDAFKADITSLATSSAVSALNDFDPASDVVANVSTVSVCTSNTDMRGTDGANTTVPDNAGIGSNGTAIAALNDFDPASDVVALVSVCTTNTDQRGTDLAATAVELLTVPKIGTAYTHTNQAGDTMTVTIS